MIWSDLLPVANHLWQSTFFAAVAGALTLLLKRNSAAVRYWLWLAASIKFLLPFSLLVSLGSRVQWRPAAAVAQPHFAAAMTQINRSFAIPAGAGPLLAAMPLTASNELPEILIGVWISGVIAGLIFWAMLLRQVSAVRRRAAPLNLNLAIPVLAAPEPARIEPGVYGVFKPVLIVPAGITGCLTAAQMDSVLAHELCHVRRRDNLTAAIHMAVEVIFWFHPLIWWVRARLLEERELACDEAVVKIAGDPLIYAEGILKICRLYAGSPMPCVSGVAGANLKKRIEAIARNRGVRELSSAKKTALAGAAIVALALPVAIGIAHLPAVHAQIGSSAQTFEVASIRPVKSCADGPVAARKMDRGPVAPAPPRQGGGGGMGTPAGRLNECRSVTELIQMAYVIYAGGRFHGVWGNQFEAGPPIEGGPGWIRSDTYRILAKAEGTPARETMRGPMLKALLEDRFKLRLHRETRRAPVYALTIAKGGPKLVQSRGGCIAFQPHQPGDSWQAPPTGQRVCQAKIMMMKPNTGIEAEATTLDEFSVLLGRVLDRPVINKTGLAGKFDIHLDFAIDDSLPRFRPDGPPPQTAVAPDEPAGISVYSAITQQLGLKLDPANGTADVLIVDHVERPSEN